eukprot:1157646-Pelagomonas_calceolata.AAC.13
MLAPLLCHLWPSLGSDALYPNITMRRNAKWTKLKLEVMTAYNAKLRAALVTEVETRTAMELQLVQQEVMHAQVIYST